MMTEKNKSVFIYVYNPLQANYYASKGVAVKATGVHPVTKKVWFKFSREETEIVYGEWCTREK